MADEEIPRTPKSKGVRKQKGTFSTFFAAGETHIRRSQYAMGIQALTEALKLEPDSRRALLLRGKAHLLGGDAQSAIDDALRLLKLNPDDWKALLQKAEALFARGDLELALVDFHRGFRLRPTERFRLGIQKTEQAIFDCFEELPMLEGSDADLLMPPKKFVPPVRGRIDLTTGRLLANEIAKLDLPDRGETPDFSQQLEVAVVAPSVLETPKSPRTVRRDSTKGTPAAASVPALKLDATPSTQVGSTPTGARSGRRSHRQKQLLGALSEDRAFLEELMTDPLITSKKVTPGMRRSRRTQPLDKLIDDGLGYLDTRAEFYRQQAPPSSPSRTPGSARRLSRSERRVTAESSSMMPLSARKTVQVTPFADRSVPPPPTGTTRSGRKTHSESPRRSVTEGEVSRSLSKLQSMVEEGNGAGAVTFGKDLMSRLNRARHYPHWAETVCDLWDLLGESYILMENENVALSQFKNEQTAAQRAKLHAKEVRALLKLGRLSVTMRKRHSAIKYLTELVEVVVNQTRPEEYLEEHLESLYLISLCRLELKSHSLALANLHLLFSLLSFQSSSPEEIGPFPEHTDIGMRALCLLGQVFTDEGKHSEALVIFDRFCSLVSFDPDVEPSQAILPDGVEPELLLTVLRTMTTCLLHPTTVPQAVKLHAIITTLEHQVGLLPL